MQLSMAMTRKLKSAARLFFPALMAILAVAGMTTAAVAQSSTAGAISGTVADASGARLPGAAIVVTSPDIGVTRSAKSNASGEYTVDNLQPGTYTATFTLDGFEVYKEEHITVTVGGVASISPKLKVGSISNTVDVQAENLDMHSQDSAISTTIDQTQIDNLPMNGRRWSDFARLTPGVVSQQSGFGLLSFRGISFLLNNNTIDGADDNQAYYSEARGRDRTAFSVPPSGIQEFQVNTSNYSAQYGRAAGGVINTVTRSGTNSLHGELFFYDRDNDLGGATNPYTLLSVAQPNGTYASVPTKPTDWRKDWGGTIGGALVRDKLYWIYTYDQERRNFPGIARPSSPNDFFAPSASTLPAGETCSTTSFTAATRGLTTEGDYNSCLIAALYGVNFQAGSAYYNQGLGILSTFVGSVPRVQDQVINLPKLDWQINDRNRMSLLYNRMRYSSPGGLYSQATENQAGSGWGNDNVKEDFGILRLSTVVNNSIVNEALAQYGRDFEFDYQRPPSPNELPLSHNAYGAAPGTQIGFYLSSGIYIGANPDLTRYADPDERRIQLLDAVTWSHGKSVFKFGLEYNKVSDFDKNLYNGNGSYSYDWTYNFIADYLNLTTGIGGAAYTYPGGATSCPGGTGTVYCQTYYSFGQSYGNAAAEIATREYAGYATDDWRVLPNLTLTLGVRYEYEYVPPSPTPNPSLPVTYGQPDDRNNIGPRVGFNWNVFGDNKTILRGGYGMYYGRIINANIVQTYLESGGPNAQNSVSSLYSGHCGPVYPNIYTSLAQVQALGCSIVPTVAYLSPHMKDPEVHEADLAIEQNLGANTTLGITYMMSLGRELPTAIDTNFSVASTAFGTFSVAPAASSTTAQTYPVSTSSEAASGTNYPYAPQTGVYITLPHGGATPPAFPTGFQEKFFLTGTRPNAAYYQILQVQSSVNSSYNALAFQIDHRYQHGLSLLANITWSHALDENPYESTVVPGYNLTDPTNPRSDYGNSNSNIPIRFVAAAVYQPQTHFHGVEKFLLDGWRIAPLAQIQSGYNYSPTISYSSYKTVTLSNGTTGTLAGTGVNGAGSSSTRVPWIARNSYSYPKTAVFDVRLGKNFSLPSVNKFGLNGEPRLELFAEIFNVMNHQNITALNTEAYTLSDSTGAGTGTAPIQTLAPFASFGTYTNSNSSYTYSPRQLQISARLHF